MSKKLSPIEALKELWYGKDIRENRYLYDIIETALNDYEKKTKLAKEYEDVDNVAKRLKAFEIIKETFAFDFELNGTITNKPTLTIFYLGEFIVKLPLTKEEYDLLKEELL